MFGYFPSYALGHLISAQLSEAMESQIGPLEQQLAAGRDGVLKEWLGRNVWPLGRQVNAEQLVEQVTGNTLSPQPFLRYLEQKLDRLCG
jgi:carboxypeptidase Taq